MRKSITHSIPGGWFGNDPGWSTVDPKFGNVVVDVRAITAAVAWLRRRATIIKTAICQQHQHGIAIDYRLR